MDPTDGIVYSAVYNGKSCVAKVMHPHLIQANQKHANLEPILREISTLSSLRHPSIVQFLGAHMKEESPIPCSNSNGKNVEKLMFCT